VKQRLRKLVERARHRKLAQWSLFAPRATDSMAWLPTDSTGWTVHRDVALRLKNLSNDERGALGDDPGSQAGAFKIRLAGHPEARREAGALVRQRYAGRGYRTSATLVHDNVCTFSAYDEGTLAGTVSLRLDSKQGLAADLLFRTEVDVLRAKGHRTCEFIRLAVDTSHASHPVLAGLFHTVFLFAQRLRGFDFAVIEVNPRHVGYYRRTLGFIGIGSERHNPRVDAPAVLMGVSFADIAGKLKRHAGKGMRPPMARNLYEHGFSPAEEAGILGRLVALDSG
jgi:hypothetical protein